MVGHFLRNLLIKDKLFFFEYLEMVIHIQLVLTNQLLIIVKNVNSSNNYYN